MGTLKRVFYSDPVYIVSRDDVWCVVRYLEIKTAGSC